MGRSPALQTLLSSASLKAKCFTGPAARPIASVGILRSALRWRSHRSNGGARVRCLAAVESMLRAGRLALSRVSRAGKGRVARAVAAVAECGNRTFSASSRTGFAMPQNTVCLRYAASPSAVLDQIHNGGYEDLPWALRLGRYLGRYATLATPPRCTMHG